jgi:hypothetical protein
MPDLAKPRQLMLVALSSTHAGEAFNALALVKRALAKLGVDIHAFVDGMGGSSARPDYGLIERVNRLEGHMASLRVELASANRALAAKSEQIRHLTDENQMLRTRNHAAHAQATTSAGSSQGSRARPGHQQMAAWLLSNGFTWNQTTEAFLIDMRTWQYPTDKQQAWLDRLWEHHGPR